MNPAPREHERFIPTRNWGILAPALFDKRVRSVLELGDKKDKGKPPYKVFFERKGYRHVSVDLNGNNGAKALDLREPLGLGQFDLVTNFGTTEHVSEQEPVWRNICEAARYWFVSTTPYPGKYPGHGIWYPKPAFYKELAALNGFDIDDMYQLPRGPKVNLCVRMKRRGMQPFRMPDESLLVREQERDKYSEAIPPRD
jgi:hypothetical protein